MKKLKFATIGCGFWAQFQIAAWHELEGVELTAVYNRTREKAENLAEKYGNVTVYDTAEELIKNEELDFVDIITHVQTHEKFVLLAAEYGLPVICQKPMAPDYQTAKKMVAACKKAGVQLIIHENWRFQAAIREVKKQLDSGVIGRPFRGRISYNNSFPVFDNQPSLAELDRFIINDMGTHILDTARFLFGEAKSIYCQTKTVHQDIKGEDVASIAMKMADDVHCNVEMSYASRIEHDRFPETFMLIEGEKGSIELAPDRRGKTTTEKGTLIKKITRPQYAWAQQPYNHPCIVDANRHYLEAIRQGREAETSGQDNLKTMQLVSLAYQSAEENRVLEVNGS